MAARRYTVPADFDEEAAELQLADELGEPPAAVGRDHASARGAHAHGVSAAPAVGLYPRLGDTSMADAAYPTIDSGVAPSPGRDAPSERAASPGAQTSPDRGAADGAAGAEIEGDDAPEVTAAELEAAMTSFGQLQDRVYLALTGQTERQRALRAAREAARAEREAARAERAAQRAKEPEGLLDARGQRAAAATERRARAAPRRPPRGGGSRGTATASDESDGGDAAQQQ